MRLIDSDRLLTDKMKSKYYHLQNGDIAIPIIDIEHAPTVEAIPKAEYEARLKADLVAILRLFEQHDDTDLIEVKYVRLTIQQKINSLKGDQEGEE